MASSPTDTSSPGDFGRSRRRTNSFTQSVASVSSFAEDLVMHRDPPLGFLAASAHVTSKAPTATDIRRGSFTQDGWGGSRRAMRSSGNRRASETHGAAEPFAPLTEESTRKTGAETDGTVERLPVAEAIPEKRAIATQSVEHNRTDHDRIALQQEDTHTSSGSAAPRVSWTTSTAIALKGFWRWFSTPFGFLVTLYGLNVVAWGGMLFLLLCNAAPAMCWAPVPNAQNQRHMGSAEALSLPGPYYRNCNDINSPRRIWLEIDSQILNALFCVTGLGLIPWRFRDLYYLLRWRFANERRQGSEAKAYGLRVLAGIHRGWFRLPGSDTLDTESTHAYLAKRGTTLSAAHIQDLETGSSATPEKDPRIPLPTTKQPSDPPTGIRAPPTSLWKLDFFIWCFVWNTFLQCCLCGFMWGYDRYRRPSWSTGLFVALACIIAAIGGWVSFKEGKKVKKIEGVAPELSDEQATELQRVTTGHESVEISASGKSVRRKEKAHPRAEV